jgi:serine/threonine protein kinase
LDRLPRVEGGRHLLGGVLISGVLGKGGMGTVYKGLHLRLHLPVAVKVLDRERSEFTGQFTTEARLAAQIEHPNIARVYDVNVEGKFLYIVQEYVEGQSVFAMLHLAAHQGVFFTEVRALELAADMARGLAAIHKQGFVHLDLKPENVLVRTSDSLAKIVDLGLAARVTLPEHLHTAQGRTNVIVGTPGYISPERFLGLPVTPACDIYAFGITLFEILTGHPGNPKHRSLSDPYPEAIAPLPDIATLRPGLGQATIDLVNACAELDPERRIGDANQVVEQIATAYRQALSATPGTIARKRAPELLAIAHAKIVCVDDDDEIRNLLKATLEMAGHTVKVFEKGWDALDYLRENYAELVLLDMEMPGLNGLQVFQALRKLPKQVQTPVVFLSSCADFQIIDTAMDLGATDYLQKPIDLVDLLARVRCLSRLTQIRRESEHLAAQYRSLESTIGGVLKKKEGL